MKKCKLFKLCIKQKQFYRNILNHQQKQLILQIYLQLQHQFRPHLQPQVKPPILPIKPEPTPLKKPFIPPTTTTTPETPKKMIPSQPQPKIEPHPKVIPIPGKPPNVQQALNQFVDRICVPETHSM